MQQLIRNICKIMRISSSYLKYWDANNLALFKDFIINYNKEKGYFLEVDIQYP